MPRRKNLELTDTMGISQIADALDNLVFTAAHGWQRSISIDRNVRDALVRRLRAPHPNAQVNIPTVFNETPTIR